MKINFDNPLFKLLKKEKLIDKKDLEFFHGRTRDSKNLNSFKNIKDKYIILEKFTRINPDKNYVKILKNKKENIVKLMGKTLVLPLTMNNNKRRFNQFKDVIKNKSVLDFGCGYGEFLSEIKKKNFCKEAHGIEIRHEVRDKLKQRKIFFYTDIEKIDRKYDVITMFHVLEHLPNPIEILKKLKRILKKNGKLIIEVPSCNDLLLRDKNLQNFRNFYMWSEHLIIFSENLLYKILKKSGFKNIKINHYQRYGMANHLSWFAFDEPASVKFYNDFRIIKSETKYKKLLEQKKQTDTLIGLCN
jgi:2-polyprenyl-3-methyl-5-hydroxy-6-metoxy-1,4-benzoquinol methylase